MKRNFLLVLATLTMGLGSAAYAQTDSQTLEQFDTNKDGKIDSQEWQAAASSLKMKADPNCPRGRAAGKLLLKSARTRATNSRGCKGLVR